LAETPAILTEYSWGFRFAPVNKEWYIGQAPSTSKSVPVDEIPMAS